jgi:hypothetical protein
VIIGFTGTRNGMSPNQIKAIHYRISELKAYLETKQEYIVGLHGDCIGADADFDKICREYGIETQCRPCTFENMRAFTPAKVIAEPKSPMQRNRDIVADADIILACPPNFERIKSGSGTWATIGFTEKTNKGLCIIFPDGTTKITYPLDSIFRNELTIKS